MRARTGSAVAWITLAVRLRRIPCRRRVFLIGLRPGVQTTCGTQAGDHQHDDRHGTSNPGHSEFLSLSTKQQLVSGIGNWDPQIVLHPAGIGGRFDSTRVAPVPDTPVPTRGRLAVRLHPDRGRQQEASVVSLVPVGGTQAFAGVVERYRNPRHRSLAASTRAILSRRPGVGSRHHGITGAIRWRGEIVALITVPDRVVGNV